MDRENPRRQETPQTHVYNLEKIHDSLQVLKKDNDLIAVMQKDVPTLVSVRSHSGDPKQLSVKLGCFHLQCLLGD